MTTNLPQVSPCGGRATRKDDQGDEPNDGDIPEQIVFIGGIEYGRGQHNTR